ncbi:hypothetical protein KQI63_08905 [bacterium]|nr:hypothetical protein [bacterium]
MLEVLIASAKDGETRNAMMLIGHMKEFNEAGMKFPEPLKAYSVMCFTRILNGESADSAFNLRKKPGHQKDYWETEARQHETFCAVEKLLEDGSAKTLEDAFFKVEIATNIEWRHVANLYYKERKLLRDILPEVYGEESTDDESGENEE